MNWWSMEISETDGSGKGAGDGLEELRLKFWDGKWIDA
jgi:hypothetical protein